MPYKHTFHIPVMGIGFTIDTPLKVAPYGIDSVMSIGDDILIEKMRSMYCKLFNLPYTLISEKEEDYRAKRIKSYLNLLKNQIEGKFEEIQNATFSKQEELLKYLSLSPYLNTIGSDIEKMSTDLQSFQRIKSWVKDKLKLGSIDVNIMTKLDKQNQNDGDVLPIEYNDAHAALRGFATSDLNASIVFSAGMNPKLFTYLTSFEDFYPDKNGYLKKRIILKVSDYRSAIIQGKFFAKKGLWVSEFRIESGLNCGGHAFATDGYLLGPILQEFKDNKNMLTNELFEIYKNALVEKDILLNDEFNIKITAQGGVGTNAEHQFLIDHFEIDSVGWGSPFLLVPEVVAIDNNTLKQLAEAKEDDIYLSEISPLGVPFNNLRGNTRDTMKSEFVAKGRPGSACPKKFLSLNTEFTKEPICTASRQYQHLKIKQLKERELSDYSLDRAISAVTEKSCICVGLGVSALLVNGIETKVEGEGVSVCPGPNLAYFDKVVSFKQMASHIYGRSNIMTNLNRPNMFIKELELYITYFKNKAELLKDHSTVKEVNQLLKCFENIENGIQYYFEMFTHFYKNNLELEFVLDKLKSYRSALNSIELSKSFA